MNSINSPAELKKIFQDYLSNSGHGMDLTLCELGLTRDNKVVRLTDYRDQQEILKGNLDSVLDEMAPILLLDRKITLQTACQKLDRQDIVEAKEQKPVPPSAPQREHASIQQLLDELKITYKKENEHLAEMTTTCPGKYSDGQECYYTFTPKDKWDKYGYCRFINTFTPKNWFFKSNFKSTDVPAHFFYMTNVVAMQYEACFRDNGWPLQLPETIHRCDISNKQSDALILKYAGQHDCSAFMDEFLHNTVNGKSTRRIADAFGLEIYQLTVCEGHIDRTESARRDNPDLPRKLFTVIAHVRLKS
ncbi:hypothetical protein [Endozoicomonas sp. SESOKO1]|uniref:hypothetical protein n=1 Tax=Endozoicomonas sp. SESOKO1 TaxID=2828742 RepID=UPI0021476157|nr:hypothetical protein [Endozoicomonas sp. SESOKO1]